MGQAIVPTVIGQARPDGQAAGRQAGSGPGPLSALDGSQGSGTEKGQKTPCMAGISIRCGHITARKGGEYLLYKHFIQTHIQVVVRKDNAASFVWEYE